MTPSASNRSYILALGALLLALFFWAIMPMILIYFSRYLDHWTANGTRYFFAASFCVPSFVRAFREMVPQERRVLLRAALFPAIAHSFSQLFFGLAPYHNSATMTNFGFRLSIPITSLLGFWLLKNERPLMKSP